MPILPRTRSRHPRLETLPLLLAVTLAGLAPAPARASDPARELSCDEYYNRLHDPRRDQVEPYTGATLRFGNEEVREVGILFRSRHPVLQALIDDARYVGGEIRVTTARDLTTGRTIAGRSYFRYDPVARMPYIAIAPEITLDGLLHEAEHFKDWRDLRKGLIARGLSGERLEEELEQAWLDPLFRRKTEARAVGAQMRTVTQEVRERSGYASRSALVPTSALPHLDVKDFIGTTSYPEAQGLALFYATGMKDPAKAEALMDSAIRKAILLRRTIWRRLGGELKDPAIPKGQRQNYENHRRAMESLTGLFDEIFGPHLHDLRGDGKSGQRVRALFEARKERVAASLDESASGGYAPRFTRPPRK